MLFGCIMTPGKINIDTLRRFTPLRKLSESQLVLLEAHVELQSYKRKQVIAETGSADNTDYFLLKGKLLLTAKDGREIEIAADSAAAANAIASLQPRQYKVTALESCELVQIESAMLAQLIAEAPKTGSTKDGEFVEFSTSVELILDNFRQDLANNTLKLPSLPNSALRINQLINWDDYSAKDVARVVNQDPAMAVKLITAASSPLFRGLSKIKTCEDAVSRLGLTTTQRLLKIYTLQELFTSKSSLITKKMQTLWHHCAEVGAIAFVLAKRIKGLSADQAMLAGLIHDIGVIPLLNYIESQNFLFQDPDAIDEVVNSLKAEAGRLLLEKWNWPAELISVAAHAEDWQYSNNTDQPDYTDVVILSQLHAAIGKREFKHYPPLHEVSSFKRMHELQLTPNKSISIINDAQAEIEEASRLLQMAG